MCIIIRMFLTASLLIAAGVPAAASATPEQPAGSAAYDDLVAIFQEFLAWKDPRAARRQPLRDVAGADAESDPDFSAPAVAQRRAEMQRFQRRLQDIDPTHWSRSRQVDYLAVRSRFDQHAFILQVSRPWSRDPGFYVDRMLRITFVDLPLAGPELESLRARLRAIPRLVAQARRNLTEVASDYADLAIFNLTHADGVGHGYPYRATPPAGVLGWYDDLLGRIDQQPELRAEATAARTAVAELLGWLRDNRHRMTGQAGVGRETIDWYLKHVKLMPYTAAELIRLGERELDRLWALYALEQHRNRERPPLLPADSAEEYQARIERTDKRIRDFLRREEIISIPDYVGELDTNVPWIVRPGGRNFWEEIQYRDPHPDHLHAVIPGHRFDGLLARHDEHPIRSHITSGARAEGWAVYLEEAMLHAGLLEELPRVRELIYAFGIFRAARVPADLWLQMNQMSVSEAVEYWMERTPYLDENVARVDAEIYLRRPPGYGLGYTIGMLQMQKLLADRKRQLGEAFELKAFHDELMALGRLPLSLIRWEMTGLDDEVREFWEREPMPRLDEG